MISKRSFRMGRTIGLGLILATSLAGESSAGWWNRGEEQCRALAGEIGAGRVWWGRFSGDKEDTFLEDFRVNKTAEACFRQRAECERWLYALKSEYQFWPRWNECRAGYAPGAPIPRL